MNNIKVFLTLIFVVAMVGCSNAQEDIIESSEILVAETQSSRQERVDSSSSVVLEESENKKTIPRGFTEEILAQLEKAYVTGAMDEFVAQNTNFLSVNINHRGKYGAGEGTDDQEYFPLLETTPSNRNMLETQAQFTAENVLINHKRLIEFYSN